MAALLPKELGELSTPPNDVDVLVIQEDTTQDVKQIKISTLFSNTRDELDAIEAGAGLEDDGTYALNTGSNYIDTATTLKGADDLLDAQIKVNEESITNLKTDEVAEVTDKKYVTDAELLKLQELEGTDKRVLTDAELLAVGTINSSGDTASRPVTPISGFNYFDTTLVQPIWYDAVTPQWVDATGTSV